MTDRLYYTDPYRREFDGTVIGIRRRDGQALVTLDQTSFYPTSGGQPFDTGTLGGFQVVDVIDEDDGRVTHVVEGGEPLTPGQAVRGVIDWPRRFDHMQQHTGQHVLSAAVDRLFGVRTVSFHLGAVVSTIDLARELGPDEVAGAENEANRVVWEDRPVTIRFVDSEAAARLPLRKQPPRTGTLRLIDVEGFDLSACGGTHVARTGAIGIIAIGAWERFKGGQRLEFLCGGRALTRFRALRDTVTAGMRLLSVGGGELPSAIERLQEETRDQRHTMQGLQTELAGHRAAELAASGEPTAHGRLVVRAVDADAAGLKSLAMAIASRPGHAAVLVSVFTPVLIVVSRSEDLRLQANTVLAALTSRFGGRGGGKPDLAQGGGLNATPEAVLEAARAAILSA
jgi:alanyl-tRNA synthetase